MGCSSSKVEPGPGGSEAAKVNEDIAQLRKTFDKFATSSGVIPETALGRFYEDVCGAPLEADEETNNLDCTHSTHTHARIVS